MKWQKRLQSRLWVCVPIFGSRKLSRKRVRDHRTATEKVSKCWVDKSEKSAFNRKSQGLLVKPGTSSHHIIIMSKYRKRISSDTRQTVISPLTRIVSRYFCARRLVTCSSRLVTWRMKHRQCFDASSELSRPCWISISVTASNRQLSISHAYRNFFFFLFLHR